MGFLLNKGSERQKEILSILKFCTEQALNGNFLVLFLVGFFFSIDRRKRYAVVVAFLSGVPTSEFPLVG